MVLVLQLFIITGIRCQQGHGVLCWNALPHCGCPVGASSAACRRSAQDSMPNGWDVWGESRCEHEGACAPAWLGGTKCTDRVVRLTPSRRAWNVQALRLHASPLAATTRTSDSGDPVIHPTASRAASANPLSGRGPRPPPNVHHGSCTLLASRCMRIASEVHAWCTAGGLQLVGCTAAAV